jgi:hypothetical protein
MLPSLASDRATALDAWHRAEGVILRSLRGKVSTACTIVDARKRRATLLGLALDLLTRPGPRGELAAAALALRLSIDRVLSGDMKLADLQREVR